MKTKFKTEAGEHNKVYPQEPVIMIIGEGMGTYLWMGNDAESNMNCYATLSGPVQLRTFANNILKSLDNKK